MFTESFQKYDFPLLGLVRLPEVKITDEEKQSIGAKKNCSNYEFLYALSRHCFKKNRNKISDKLLDKYQERARYELEIFEELGFTDYVLLVWKIVNKLRNLGQFVDYGRGSCAGSFIFGLLGITGIIDVIEKGLLFERFVSRVRSKKEVIDGITYLHGDMLCDADLNLGGGRDEIVRWLNEEYKGKICRINAFNTLTPKSLINDVYKTINEVDATEARRVSDMVEKHAGFHDDIEDTVNKNENFKEWTELFPETYRISLQLRDLIRQKMSHASGYFLSFYELDGFVPTELNKEGELTIAYEMKDAASLGVKLDLLGLIQCEIFTEFFNTIPEKAEDVDLEHDPIIYDNLQKDYLPHGIYQISGNTARKAANKIKPKTIEELSDVNAIGRPGALDYLDAYAQNEAKSPHPIFDEIVKPTRGLFLYQEQLMKAIVAIGFTLDDAEICRKIVGKKLKKEFPAWEQKIRDKVKENNLPPEVANIVWKVLIESSGYSFNKSHSLGVSYLGALTLWAKYKYSLQFYTACLNHVKYQSKPAEALAEIQHELKYFGIQLMPPDIHKSTSRFTMEDGNIRFSLESIKGVSVQTIEKINNFKGDYSSKIDIFNAANEAKLGIGVLCALIQSGCLSSYCKDMPRSKLVLEAQLYNVLTPKEKRKMTEVGENYNYDIVEILKAFGQVQPGAEKPFIKESRMNTIRKKFCEYRKIYTQNSRNESLACWFYETTLLGYAHSNKLHDVLKVEYHDLVTINEFASEVKDFRAKIAGEIVHVNEGISKKNGKPFRQYKIDDSTGVFKIHVRDSDFEKNDALNHFIPLKKGDVVVADGKSGGDIMWCNSVVNQKIKIYTKLSQVTNSEKKEGKNK